MVGRIDVNHAFVAALIPSPLPVTSGGTGRTALTNHGVLLGENTSPINAAVGTDGQYLRGQTGADPAFGTIPLTDLPSPWNSYSGGGWTPYTPTVTAPGASGISFSGNATYLQIGKIVFVSIRISVFFSGTASYITASYPPVTPFQETYLVGRETITNGSMFTWRSSDGAFITFNNLTFTDSGSTFPVSAVYEAA